MGYVAKNRVGQWSGFLEIVSLAGRAAHRELVWNAVCHRVNDGEECGRADTIRASYIGEKMHCRHCGTRDRAKANTGRTKYEWTPAMDDMIRRIHRERAGKRSSDLPSYAEYARRIRRPKHVVIQRARKLGLEPPAPKEPAWSEEELRRLRRWAWMTPRVIQQKLKQAGFNRSVTAVTLKRKRLNLHAAREWLNARELAEALGIDSHKVALWVKRGLLHGNWREFDSDGDGRKGEYVFREHYIRRFILMNPTEVDLRKVDQLWFFDIITQGKFGENYYDAGEEGLAKGGRRRAFVETEKNRVGDAEPLEPADAEDDEPELVEHDYTKAAAAF